MAKQRAPSKHSRAARRATSPSIDTDKSLKDIKPPPRGSTGPRPSVLAIHQSSGVQKKASRRGQKSQMSTKARRRHEKGLQMAEAIIERTSQKVELSKVRGRSVQARAKAWDEINKKAVDGMDVNVSDEDEGEAKGTTEDKGWETDEEMNAKKESAEAPKDVETEGYIPIDDDDDIIL